MTTDDAVRILSGLAVRGNTVAATWLHVLKQAENRGEAREVLRQIDNFITSFSYEAHRIGPSEFKADWTYTVPPELER